MNIKILELYNYMYYRLAKGYFKFEGESRISFGATAIVSLSQILIILDIMGTFFVEFYHQSERKIIFNSYYPYFIGFMLLVSFLNDFKYKNKYNRYHEKWKDETQKQKTLGTIIISSMIIIPLIYVPILLNVFDFTK